MEFGISLEIFTYVLAFWIGWLAILIPIILVERWVLS